MTEEIWKPIAGYEDTYEVSNHGRVRSTDRIDAMGHHRKSVVLKSSLNQNGYLKVSIFGNGTKKRLNVHRLVALAFVEGYAEGLVVNHKDENKQNNRADNLEWITPVANNNYGTRNKRDAKSKYKPVEQYTPDGQLVATYPSMMAACEATGANPALLSRVIGTKYKAKKFLWKFKQVQIKKD